jgi:D-glycero-alpha-D-manno-heptose 1-phosphate guanylyltransferase
MSERGAKTVTAVILAGGKGTRLSSVVADRAKPLAGVDGRPFVTRLFDQLIHAGVREAVLCTGHLGEGVRAQLGDRYADLGLTYSQEPEPLGTGGAARLGVTKAPAGTAVVMNGDAYCDVDMRELLSEHSESGATATILVTHLEDTARYGRVEVDGDGAVTAFREKQVGAGAGWINAGVYVVTTSRLLELPDGRAVSLEREVFPSWIGDGFRAHQRHAAFLDIGTPESYAAAEEFFRSVHS